MNTAESSVLRVRDDALPVTRMVALAVAFAAALAVAAQVRVPLPFTPVPITLQTLVLYVGAAWLGTRMVLPGLALYVGMAILGVPVMSGWRGGLAAFTGATGGYILGWFVAAIVLSKLLDGRSPSWPRTVGSMGLASAIVLSCGTLHLGLLLDLSPGQAFLMGAAPFIPGDALKILLASSAVRRWTNPLSTR